MSTAFGTVSQSMDTSNYWDSEPHLGEGMNRHWHFRSRSSNRLRIPYREILTGKSINDPLVLDEDNHSDRFAPVFACLSELFEVLLHFLNNNL